MVLKISRSLVVDHRVGWLELEDPLTFRPLDFNEDHMLVKVDIAVFLYVEVKAVFKRKTWKFKQLRQLSGFKLSVVLLDEVFFRQMWMEAPQPNAFIRDVLKP